MAAAAVTATAGDTSIGGDSLQAKSIPIVDLRLLSQSDLYSLSLCSPSPSFCDDVVIPKIDRSVFNESAGSRKQTYSRLRLAPPSSGGGGSTAGRRRTPHLRSSAAISVNFNSDPENAENAQIVTLLQQLFVPDMDPGKLVPVKVDYSDSVLPEQIVSNVSPVGQQLVSNVSPLGQGVSSSVSPIGQQLVPSVSSSVGPIGQQSVSNVYLTGQKRKRGRPRKDEILARKTLMESTMEVFDVHVKDSVAGIPMVSDVFVHEKVEDRDRELLGENAKDKDKELLNKDGVAVDLVALRSIEHPFWEEIRRRTQGLSTEEQLLGFLNDLEGQWGSRRKKRRIVDASEFGNALPIGWKLLLSIKKKSGAVWVHCRRYLSPSGQQFVSCKDVSSYLLSLHGLQDTNLHEVQNNDALNSNYVNITDVANKNDAKESPATNASFASASGNVNDADMPDDRVGDMLYCKKCNLTFNERVDFLQHQSSVHPKNRCRTGVSVTDGVIIKDGKYECQFCHKVFTERHRYNGHAGAHVRYQAKMAGDFPAGDTGESVPMSCNHIPVQDTTTGSNNVSEVCNASLDNGPCNKDNGNAGDSKTANGNSREVGAASTNNGPCNKDNDHVGDSKEGNDNISKAGDASLNNGPCNKKNDHFGDTKEVNDDIREVREATAVNLPKGPLSVSDLFCSDDEKDFDEHFDQAHENDSPAEMAVDDPILQGGSGNDFPLPYDEKTDNVVNTVIENSASVEKPKQDMISETMIGSNNYVEVSNTVGNNGQICQAKNELKIDGDNIAVTESLFEFLKSHDKQDKDIAVSVKQPNEVGEVTNKNISNSDNTSNSASILSKGSNLNEVVNVSMQALSNGEKLGGDDNVFLIGNSSADDTCKFGTYRKSSPEGANDVLSNAEMHLGSTSVISSCNEQASLPKKYDSAHLLNKPSVQDASNKDLVALPSRENSLGAETMDGTCGSKMQISEWDGIQNFRNDESANHFSGSSAFNLNSTTAREYSRDNNVFRVFGTALEEHKVKPSGGVLFGQYNVSEFSNAGDTRDEIYSPPVIQYKLDETENARKQDLNLSFGNLQAELHADSNSIDQEQYPLESFKIQSVGPKTYNDQVQLGSISSNTPGDLKDGRNFGAGFLDSSFNNRGHPLFSNFNMAPTGGSWNGSSRDKVATHGQNIMRGFGNSGSQSINSMANESWLTGREDAFRNSFHATPSPQVYLSSDFGTYDQTSNKGEGSSGVNESYRMHTNVLGAERSEPVEYSFMGEQSSNSLPVESKIFPYTPNPEQGTNSSFWLGNDALMQNTGQSNQVPSVCVWCRNLYYQDPAQNGLQLGAIGSMCPSCSSRIPGQFNAM